MHHQITLILALTLACKTPQSRIQPQAPRAPEAENLTQLANEVISTTALYLQNNAGDDSVLTLHLEALASQDPATLAALFSQINLSETSINLAVAYAEALDQQPQSLTKAEFNKTETLVALGALTSLAVLGVLDSCLQMRNMSKVFSDKLLSKIEALKTRALGSRYVEAKTAVENETKKVPDPVKQLETQETAKYRFYALSSAAAALLLSSWFYVVSQSLNDSQDYLQKISLLYKKIEKNKYTTSASLSLTSCSRSDKVKTQLEELLNSDHEANTLSRSTRVLQLRAAPVLENIKSGEKFLFRPTDDVEVFRTHAHVLQECAQSTDRRLLGEGKFGEIYQVTVGGKNYALNGQREYAG